MVWVAQEIGLSISGQVIVGVATIVGHNWPVFLSFSGGRGILTTLGVVFILMPWGLAVFLVIASLSIPLKSTPLPVLAGIAALPIASWAFGEPLSIILGFLFIFLIVIIRRLTARQTVIAPTDKKQLILNRLLFDRDIRDKEAWLHRVPPEANSSKQPAGQQEKQEKG